MAKQVVEQVVDDITREPGAETLAFRLRGESFEIDLAGRNAERMKTATARYRDALEKLIARYESDVSTFVVHARRVAEDDEVPARPKKGRDIWLVKGGSSGVDEAPAQNRSIATAAPPAGSKEWNRKVREWAIAKGYDVAERGRIKVDIVEAFRESTA